MLKLHPDTRGSIPHQPLKPLAPDSAWPLYSSQLLCLSAPPSGAPTVPASLKPALPPAADSPSTTSSSPLSRCVCGAAGWRARTSAAGALAPPCQLYAHLHLHACWPADLSHHAPMRPQRIGYDPTSSDPFTCVRLLLSHRRMFASLKVAHPPPSFRYYNKSEVIEGKTMAESLSRVLAHLLRNGR